ncbi:dihydropteroate synthase [Ignisphaera sp. 4213-co]|uniref:Dihydropteroate synthase n=1 Tax=Ignisphaera cupida TaxID=3050454 RepID=A0ABD4Z4P6_9CREN|nr:dihydropteroate synthase [Ignisphaera sp. 4213-co]MDK6027913.1 dihydropteroate synthase [Ignisphaera sp. 4213-co]
MVLAELEEIRILNKPILVGVSRKSFIGEITELRDPSERLYGSLAATAIAVFNGAHIIRTHDPLETKDVIKVAEFIRRSKYSL